MVDLQVCLHSLVYLEIQKKRLNYSQSLNDGLSNHPPSVLAFFLWLVWCIVHLSCITYCFKSLCNRMSFMVVFGLSSSLLFGPTQPQCLPLSDPCVLTFVKLPLALDVQFSSRFFVPPASFREPELGWQLPGPDFGLCCGAGKGLRWCSVVESKGAKGKPAGWVQPKQPNIQ